MLFFTSTKVESSAVACTSASISFWFFWVVSLAATVFLPELAEVFLPLRGFLLLTVSFLMVSTCWQKLFNLLLPEVWEIPTNKKVARRKNKLMNFKIDYE